MKIFINRYKFLFMLGIITCLIFTLLELIVPNYFLFDDNAVQFLAFYKYNFSSIFEFGEIPLINFHQYLGHTYFGQGQTAVFYPPIYFSVLLSKIIFGEVNHAIDIVVLIHLIAASISFYLLLCFLKVEEIVSFFCALIWATLPYFILLSKGWVIMSYFLLFIPLSFLFFLRLFHKIRPRDAFFLALVQALFIFQGYIQNYFIYQIFEVLFFCIYMIVTLILNRGISSDFYQRLKIYTYSKIILILLTLPVLLTVFNTTNSSLYRSGKIPYVDFMRNHITLDLFFNAQILNFTKGAIFGTGSYVYFSGLIFTLLAAVIILAKSFKICRTKKTYISIFIILAAVSFLFSTQFYSFFYDVPFLNKFRWPFKYFAISVFFQILIFSFFMNIIYTNSRRLRFLIPLVSVIFISINIYCLIDKPKMATGSARLSDKGQMIADHIENYGRIFTMGKTGSNRSIYMGDNFATFYGKYHFAGYDPLVSKKNAKASLYLQHRSTYKNKLDKKLFEYLNYWGVKYFVVAKKNKGISENVLNILNKIYSDEEITLYENPRSFPLVYYLNDNYRTTHNDLRNPPDFEIGVNSIKVKNNELPGSYILANIVNLENYNIYVDGLKQDIKVKDKENKLVLKVPEYSREIIIKYEDKYFYYGALISLLTLVFFVFLLVFKKI